MNTKLSPIVVKNSLPAEIVAIQLEVLKEVGTLTAEALSIEVKDVETLETGNTLYKRIDALAKSVSSGRLEITRPIDALKKAIIEAEEQATLPLQSAKDNLGKKIVACQKELQRIRDETERKAREEAEKKAAEERIRLEAERQAEIKKQQEAYQAELEAKKAEAAMFGEDPEELPPPPLPPPVVVVPVVVVPTSGPALPKAAARASTRKRLVIDNPDLIPVSIGGARLLVPDEKAITKLLQAGVKVAGCRLEDYETVGAAGGWK